MATHLYSCTKNPMDRGAWWATVHEVTESDTTECLSTILPFTVVSMFYFLPHPLLSLGFKLPRSGPLLSLLLAPMAEVLKIQENWSKTVC